MPRTQFIVENDQIRPDPRKDLGEFGQLARADQRGRVYSVQPLHGAAHNL